MSSTPLMASSIGVATVSATTLGLAPGYWARTTTEGGTTSGYSEIGRAPRASRPAMKMSTDRTPAKIGRSTKNLEMFMDLIPERQRGQSTPQRATGSAPAAAVVSAARPAFIGTVSGAT